MLLRWKLCSDRCTSIISYRISVFCFNSSWFVERFSEPYWIENSGVHFIQTLRRREACFTSAVLGRSCLTSSKVESVQQCCVVSAGAAGAWTTVSGWRWSRKHVVCHRSPFRWSLTRRGRVRVTRTINVVFCQPQWLRSITRGGVSQCDRIGNCEQSGQTQVVCRISQLTWLRTTTYGLCGYHLGWLT